MNESLKNDNCIKNISSTSTSKTTDDVMVSTNDDIVKEKFMELLKNGPESGQIIDYISLFDGFIQFELNETYGNAVISASIMEKPPMIYMGKDGVMYIEDYVKEDFGKKWEELAIKSLPKFHSGLRY